MAIKNSVSNDCLSMFVIELTFSLEDPTEIPMEQHGSPQHHQVKATKESPSN